MKTTLLLLSMLISTHSFAAKCILDGWVKEGREYSHFVVKLDVDDLAACKTLAESTEKNNFFQILDGGPNSKQRLISTKYKFKDPETKKKTKGKIVFAQNDENID